MSEHTVQPISDSDVERRARESTDESTSESNESLRFVLIHNDDVR